MSATDNYRGKIFKGGNRNVHRRISQMIFLNNRWHIVYRNCSFTEKQGWYDFGDVKRCQRRTFNAWAKEEINVLHRPTA